MAAVIDARNIVKIYYTAETALHALRGVSLAVERGDFVALMGPSGSGKSTFLNIIGCLDQPTEGRYFLDSLDVSRLDRDRLADIRNRKIGFVFQNFNLLPRTTAVDNVELPMLYRRGPALDRRRRALAALKMVGLLSHAGHRPNQLSGGEQQRVAIARALVNHPDLILADEPTGSLDSRSSIEIMTHFQRLNRQYGMTIVMVTHEPDIAAHANRIVRFRDGRILDDRLIQTPRDAVAELASTPLVEDAAVVSL